MKQRRSFNEARREAVLSANHIARSAITFARRLTVQSSKKPIFSPVESRARNFERNGEVLGSEFLPQATEIRDTPPSPIRIHLATTICVLFAMIVSSTWLFRVDIYATAPGRVQPMGRSKPIQSLYEGAVHKLYVEQGSRVKAGGVLVDLDRTEAAADQTAASLRVSALEAEVIRRKLALGAVTPETLAEPTVSFPSLMEQSLKDRETALLTADMRAAFTDIAVFNDRVRKLRAVQNSLQSSIEGEKTLVGILAEKTEIRASLAKEGWEARAGVLDALENLSRERAKLYGFESQQLELPPQIAELQSQIAQRIAQFRMEYTKALGQAEESLDIARQELTKNNSKLGYMRILAPVSGVVQQISVTTAGQVVTPGQQLMTIVPQDGDLELEALVQSRDIGFVKEGQEAIIKIDAFPYQRYGVLKGIVKSIARDAVGTKEALQAADTEHHGIIATESAASAVPQTQDLVYSVVVALRDGRLKVDGSYARPTPGMTATVEIQTGSRRILEYILFPLLDAKNQAFHER